MSEGYIVFCLPKLYISQQNFSTLSSLCLPSFSSDCLALSGNLSENVYLYLIEFTTFGAVIPLLHTDGIDLHPLHHRQTKYATELFSWVFSHTWGVREVFYTVLASQDQNLVQEPFPPPPRDTTERTKGETKKEKYNHIKLQFHLCIDVFIQFVHWSHFEVMDQKCAKKQLGLFLISLRVEIREGEREVGELWGGDQNPVPRVTVASLNTLAHISYCCT